jgi:hypothetical protein
MQHLGALAALSAGAFAAPALAASIHGEPVKRCEAIENTHGVEQWCETRRWDWYVNRGRPVERRAIYHPPAIYDEGVIQTGVQEPQACFTEAPPSCGEIEGTIEKGVHIFTTVDEPGAWYGWQIDADSSGQFAFYGQAAWYAANPRQGVPVGLPRAYVLWPSRGGKPCGPAVQCEVTDGKVTDLHVSCR